MTAEPGEWEGGGVLRAVLRRLLDTEHWCESWAHGCPLDSSLAVYERTPLPPPALERLEPARGAVQRR